jgi:tRNA modification GTPase
MIAVLNHMDTIFALSSGAGRSGIAVIRVSGPGVQSVVTSLSGPLPSPRTAVLRALRDPETGDVIDRGLVLFFPGPGSFTGEDLAEFQVHGGRAIIRRLLMVLGKLAGCRSAAPGEFTWRALLNGRMDLTAVEGLADLIAADTEEQRRQALRQAEGALGEEARRWRSGLIDAMALIEASIDFSDEGDLQASVTRDRVRQSIGAVKGDIDAALANASRGERLRDGFMVVIAGPPNAGKSTLLNALARREVAIVSPEPGTTRDVIEVSLDLDGLPVLVIDTAGIREATGPIEAEGIARAVKRALSADLVLWLEPAGGHLQEPVSVLGPIWRIATKIDSCPEQHHGSDFAISALTGMGLSELLAAISSAAADQLTGGDALITCERHRLCLAAASTAIERAQLSPDVELAAEDLRAAARDIAELLGLVRAEDVLDAVFARFCIGK